MIVCICAKVSELDILSVLREKATLQHVRDTTGACKQCKMCRDQIEEMISFPETCSPVTAGEVALLTSGRA